MIEVNHRPEKNRYEVALDSETAYLAYRQNGDVLDLYSTQVPVKYRGRGIAAAIVKKALDDAAAQGQKVIPSCSYVAAYIERYPQYRALLADRD